jgi:hypothetical protein
VLRDDALVEQPPVGDDGVPELRVEPLEHLPHLLQLERRFGGQPLSERPEQLTPAHEQGPSDN